MSKCARVGCEREALEDRMCCSGICAQGLRREGENIRSIRALEASSTTETGDQSEPSSDTESEPEPSDALIINGRTNDSDDFTEETSSLTDSRKSPDEEDEIPFTASTTSLSRVEEAISNSLSLIDDSAEHLLELQRSIQGPTETEPNLRIDAQKINAACNCAKQIASLQRLKIEAFKALKE